jgi:hypothetical protein
MPNPTDGFAPNLTVLGLRRVFVEVLRVIEHVDGSPEVQTVFGQIGLALGGIPIEVLVHPRPGIDSTGRQ